MAFFIIICNKEVTCIEIQQKICKKEVSARKFAKRKYLVSCFLFTNHNWDETLKTVQKRLLTSLTEILFTFAGIETIIAR